MRKQNLDQEVIRQARATLAQASKGALVYRYLRIVYSEKPGFRLDLAAGLNADRVLRRRSGTSLSTPVQGLYTKDVFFDVVSRGTASLVAQFAQEQWVWGEQASALSGTIELTTNLLDVYEKDYIATWDKIVKDIEPIPMSGLRNTKDSLSILSGPASPLKAIFRAIDQHTYLVTPPKEPEKKESSGLPNLSDVFKGAAGRVGIPTVAPGTQVTKYFEDIHKLVSGDGGGPAPIDGVVRTLGQIQEKLNPLGDGVGERKPDPNSIRELSELGNSLKRDAAVLPPAIGAAVNVIADDTLKNLGATNRTTTGTSYDERVLAECRQVVDNRYPFFTASPNDVPLENFAGVFGPNGAFDAFFKSDLQDRVNTRPPWSWKVDASGAATGGVPLSQFEAAERIRGMFFPSQQLQVRFTLTPIYLDPGAGRFTMEIDGQPLTYQYGPERPFDMTWPGPKPGLAVASFDKAGGQATPAFNGPWALFRLLDSGQLTRDSDDRFTFTLRRGEREVRLRLSAGNLRNPFGNTDLQRFRCR
jgi:type VI secretion system protein ImpL